MANHIKIFKQRQSYKVSSSFKFVKNDLVNYDELVMLNLETETGFVGHVVQDVVTYPPVKSMRLQAENEAIEWNCIANPYSDIVRVFSNKTQDYKFEKSRSDDFYCELDLLEKAIINNEESPISLENCIETMLVIKAAHISYKTGKSSI